MRTLAVMTAALLFAGSGAASAQQTGTRSTSLPSTMSAGGGRALGTIPTPGGSVLGALPQLPGTAASLSASAIGSLTTCPAGPGPTLDASNALTTGGGLVPQPLPGATAPVGPAFGPSISTGACNPSAATQSAAEAVGTAVTVTPIPGLATVDPSQFSDATIPSTATEAGTSGFSPQVVEPGPDVPSASPGP